jgi:hypothetical protein
LVSVMSVLLKVWSACHIWGTARDPQIYRLSSLNSAEGFSKQQAILLKTSGQVMKMK